MHRPCSRTGLPMTMTVTMIALPHGEPMGRILKTVPPSAIGAEWAYPPPKRADACNNAVT